MLLQKPGVTIRDVAELVGDTEQTILRFRGSWVEARQARLTQILREAFEDRPKLLSIEGGSADHQYGESTPPVLGSVPLTMPLNFSLNLSNDGGSLVAGKAQWFS